MPATTGRAAVLRAFNQPLEVTELPLATPEPGALLVKIDVATVCGSDVHIWEGDMGPSYRLPLPIIPGHEMVGIVQQLGAGADVDSVGQALRPGDRVVWSNATCHHCRRCTVEHTPTLCRHRRFVGLEDCSIAPHFVGAFAEYGYVLPASGRLRVPDDVESPWASAGSCALRSVVDAVAKAGVIDYLDSVVVQGAGPLGLFTTAIAAMHGPRHLVVIGAPDARLEVAREWGATHTISVEDHPTPGARRDAVLSIVGADGPSVMIEVSGAPGAAAEGIDLVGAGGRYVIAGTLGGPRQSIDVSRISTGALRISGSFSGDIDSYYKAMEFLRRHRDRFDWNRMLGSRYGLDDATELLRAMKRGDQIKPVFDPWQTA